MERLPVLEPNLYQVDINQLQAPYSTREWKAIKRLISPLQVEFGMRYGLWPNAGKLQMREESIESQPPGSKWKLLVISDAEASEGLRMDRSLGYYTGYANGHPREEYAISTYGPMPPEIRKMYEAAYREGRIVEGYNIFDQWLFSKARPDLQQLDLKLETEAIERMYKEDRWFRSKRDPRALEVVMDARANWIEAVKDYWANRASARRHDGGLGP